MYTLYSLFSFLRSDQIGVLIFVTLIVVLSELFVRQYKRKTKEEFTKQKEEIVSLEEVESVSYNYYNRLKIVDVVRIVVVVVVLALLAIAYDIRALNLVAVAFGAIIINLRDIFISFIGYILTFSRYTIGDDIRVAGMLGEIVRITPLTTSLAGKDENGEYNGKLYSVPNNRFVTELVERQELKSLNARRVIISAVYNYESFQMPFVEWLSSVRLYLDEIVPKKTLKEVGNFKGYAGIKYKLGYDYDTDGEVIVKISFVTSPKKANPLKEEIIAHIESMRKGYAPKK